MRSLDRSTMISADEEGRIRAAPSASTVRRAPRTRHAPRRNSLIRGFLMSAVMLVTLASSSIAQAPRRAILASFDGFSEEPLRRFADSATAPHIWAMFRASACAESVRPAFPSVTPTGHAAIWTGAYANVNGVSASSNGALPLPETTILDWIDGYRAAALRAEPIWITAARQGKRV